MSLDIEDIRKGRRKEWDALRDPEDVKRERKEALEADPEYQKRKSAWKQRQDREKGRYEEMEKEWRKVRREVFVILSAITLLIAGYVSVNMIVNSIAERARIDKGARIAAYVESGRPYASFSDPIETWGSWRSAWIRKDAEAIMRTWSPRRAGGDENQRSPAESARRMQQQIDRGDLDSRVRIAEAFKTPEMLRVPSRRPRNQELAVFVSEYFYPHEDATVMRQYVLALAWNERRREWQVEDLRDIDVWSVRWSTANQISVSRVRTAVYD